MALLLNKYTAVGGAPTNWSHGNNTSGVDYDPSTNRIGIVRNNAAEMIEYSLDDLTTEIRTISLGGMAGDTEGLVYMGNGEIAISVESGGRYEINICDLPTGTSNIGITPKQTLTLAAPGSENNSGLEGSCYDQENQIFYGVGEGEQPGVDRKFFKVIRPTNTTTDYTYTDPELVVTEPFVAETVFGPYDAALAGPTFDLSGITFHPRTGHVVVCSHRGRRLLHLDPNTGEIFSEYDATGMTQLEGVCFTTNEDILMVGEIQEYWRLSAPPAPVIVQPPHATVSLNSTFTYTPSLSQGGDGMWFKEFGPDGMTVNPETGAISWDTSELPRGQGCRVTIGYSNHKDEDLKTFVVHVDATGTSELILVNGVSNTQGAFTTTTATTIRAAGQEISSGDTLVVPDGHFWASTSSQNSGENTWDNNNLDTLATGLSNQHTTIISEGYTIVDAAPHDAISRDDKGIESVPTNTGQYYKFSGMEWTGSNRGPVIFRQNGTLLEFCGGTDGSYAVTPTTQAEADAPFANVAGTYIGGNSTAENCFGFGDARYIFQSGNFTSDVSFNRCIARPDEYNGTNPRGGIIHYSVDNSGTFSSFVIDGDQEDKTPFYNNYAGSFGLPATGNETHAQSQLMRGCAAINVDMNPILNDSTSGTNTLVIEDFLLLDTTNTVTPWTHATSFMGIQSDSPVNVTRIAMSETHRWDYATNSGGYFFGASGSGSSIDGAIFDRLGWDGVSSTLNLADLALSFTIDNANLYDFKGSHSATNVTTTDPKANGWDYPTRAEEGSPIAILGQAPDLTKFAAPSSHLPEDIGWNVATDKWMWPFPEEQHIASRMATYSKTNIPVRHPNAATDPIDFTGSVNGARGFAEPGESFSEYIWGQFGRTVPPLRVSATATGNNEVTFRIGKYRSDRGNTITKYNVYEKGDLVNPVLSFYGNTGILTGTASGAKTYVVRAVDPSKTSAYGSNETGESGNSRDMPVTVTGASSGSVTGTSTNTLSAFTQSASGSVVAAHTGTVTQSLQGFTQNIAGDGILAITATVTQSLQGFSNNVAATRVGEWSGMADSSLQGFSQNIATTVFTAVLTVNNIDIAGWTRQGSTPIRDGNYPTSTRP